jgi:dihydrofolate reductase
MAKVRVHNFSITLDGYGAGPEQNLEYPIGLGGERLHAWIFETEFGRSFIGESGGTNGIDNDFLLAGEEGIGATIIGRNMFGPVRGPWSDEQWKGWWGDDPPYHHPVFVLTHHPRNPIVMEGGTTFHFVTEGIETALDRALEAAKMADVRIGGGVSTLQQFLRAGLIDEMHLAMVPILLGSGERLFDGQLGNLPGYECVQLVGSEKVVHARFVKVT